MITDFHTHAFPENIALHAIPKLETAANEKANTNGTIKGLLESMDHADIERSIICSIATKPDHFTNIIKWSKSIKSPRIIPLPSIHPMDTDVKAKIAMIKQEGFCGVKMHPYYQDFFLSHPLLTPIYESLIENDLFVVMHTGLDIAFTPDRRASPQEVLTVTSKFPELKFIATHFGSWNMWDEVENTIIGRPLFIEISLALQFLSTEQAVRMFKAHPSDYLLFGSDSPWEDQKGAITRLRNLGLDRSLEEKILSKNANQLLSV